MRQFRSLFRVEIDEEANIMYIVGEKGTHDYPALMIRREGENVLMSVNYGPLELALKLSHDELTRTLLRLQPINGLQTTRQVGSTSAYLGLGLREDSSLTMRPTIIADARGHITFNITLPSDARQAMYDWLGIADSA